MNKVSLVAKQPVDIWATLAAGIERDGDRAALAHLEAGYPVYRSDADTPANAVIRENPDGSRDLVRFDGEGEHTIKPLG